MGSPSPTGAGTRSSARRRARSHRRRGGARPRRHRARHARVLLLARAGPAAAMARPREGRPPPGDGAPSSTRSGTCGRRREGKPLWKLVVDLTPEQLVSLHRLPLPDRRARRPSRRSRILRTKEAAQGRRARRRSARSGYPGLHHVRRLARLPGRQGAAPVPEAVADGWTHIKMKVGKRHRGRRPPAPRIIREEIGPDAR